MKFDRMVAVRNNKTVYRSGDLCYKVFDDTFSKANILNEALNQARVEETGLKIPKLREVGIIDGKWAIVYEFVEGKTLYQLISEDPDNKSKYLHRLVDVQTEINSKTCPLLTKHTDKMKRKIAETDFDETTKYELNVRLESMPKHNKLLHGDLTPSNVIITPADEAFIIDWSHATQGNASADAARTYLTFWLKGDIEGAEEYLDIFCEKSNTPKKYVQKWMSIVAASQSVKGSEKEAEFLKNWVNVAEYQ